jgi:5-(carboxyamino)imidazole ribonucleotide synthase
MFLQKKIGVLGAGQLGRMLAQASADWLLPIHGLDADNSAPAAEFYHSFQCGSFADYDTVIAFGKDKDVVTIEIEHVNTKALRVLSDMGIKVFPQPEVIETIQDKGLQKLFYAQKNIPTAPFELVEDKANLENAIKQGHIKYPFVQKSRKAGYDGKGVIIINNEDECHSSFDCPSLIEKKASIQKELAVIVSRHENGETSVFPVVEMLFNAKANLVENVLCPALIPESIENQCKELAIHIIENLNMIGILAVEFFWQTDGSLWVNECAPRPHNSGHHTIEACYTSQYQQHLRAICGLSPGDTRMKVPFALMVNLLGDEGETGAVWYEGLEEVMNMPKTYVHLYGKKDTKPFRKMGHVTLLGNTAEEVVFGANKITNTLRIIQKPT